MVTNTQNLRHILLTERRRKNVVLTPRHLLVAQAGLKKPACCSATEILGYQRIDGIATERLLRQQNSASGSVHYTA